MTSPETPATLVGRLLFQAERRPNAEAFTFLADGENPSEQVTYGELDQRARSLAVELSATVQTGDRVIVCCRNPIAFITGVFGTLFAGSIPVPAVPPRMPADILALARLTQFAGARAGVTDIDLAPLLGADEPGVLSALTWLPPLSSADATHWMPPAIGADDLVFLAFTSGSTAQPKGVMLTHRSVLSTIDANVDLMKFDPTSNARSVTWLPIYVTGSLILVVVGALCLGFPATIMPPESFMARPARWLEAISRYRGTVSTVPNFAYDLVLQSMPVEERRKLDLSTWRIAFNGGEQVRAETLERFTVGFAEARFNPAALISAYGLTEAGAITLAEPGEPLVIRAFDREALEGGRALPLDRSHPEVRTLVGQGGIPAGHTVKIVDPDSLLACDDGQVGEIWSAGASVAAGYWQDPAETDRVFRAHLATGEGPFFRTGDLGVLLDGQLFVTGRHKELLIVRGRNISPEDVEVTVSAAHPALRGLPSAVFSIEAEGEEQVVVLQEIPASVEDAGTVSASIRRAVAVGHGIQPASLLLLREGTIPRTGIGKIARTTARRQFHTDRFASETIAES
jgi:acyl-CoA synthetase (AMP-forming)/AMP-acid ligase II